MSEFQMPINNDPNWKILDYFTRGYFEAAFFTECNSDNEELENATFSDVHISSLNAVIEDCRLWQDQNEALLNEAYERDYDSEQAGRDYWFTRNGHGVGFWDREALKPIGDDWESTRIPLDQWTPEMRKLREKLESESIGQRLSEACGRREVYMYRGDDGRVYFS